MGKSKVNYNEDNRRENLRFSDITFHAYPLKVAPIPPFFGDNQVGNLVNLGSGGILISLERPIPINTQLHLTMTFPDHSVLRCQTSLVWIQDRGDKYFMGLRFLDLQNFQKKRIDKMATDYLECEKRIERNVTPVCKPDCRFYSICKKIEKRQSETDLKKNLEVKLEKRDLPQAA